MLEVSLVAVEQRLLFAHSGHGGVDELLHARRDRGVDERAELRSRRAVLLHREHGSHALHRRRERGRVGEVTFDRLGTGGRQCARGLAVCLTAGASTVVNRVAAPERVQGEAQRSSR